MSEAAGEAGLPSGLLRRDPAAFVDLVRVYQERLFNFALRYLGRPEDAEEAVQDAFLKAHRDLYRRLPLERVQNLALTPWLYKVVLNTCRNRVRRRQLVAFDLREVEATLSADGGSDPALVGERAALRRALEDELRRLPPRYRAAVVLHLVEGLPYADVATVLGLPVGTAKSHVHRGANLMRPALEPWWVAERGKEGVEDGR